MLKIKSEYGGSIFHLLIFIQIGGIDDFKMYNWGRVKHIIKVGGYSNDK